MTSVKTLINDPVLLRLIFACVILFITAISKHYLGHLLLQCLSKIQIKHIKLNHDSFDSLQKPIHYLIVTIGIFLALIVSPFVYFYGPNEALLTLGTFKITLSFLSFALVSKCFGAIFIALTTWLIYNFEHLYEQLFWQLNDKLSFTDNTIIVRYTCRIIRFITIALGASIALTLLFPGLSGVVTGVGIGGVAIAFVSKDSLASIVSGMVLLLDKPFIINDWIAIDNIEGIVEDISFRSTHVRTFDQGLVIIPNNTIGNATIINWSRMEKRRVRFELGLAYSTSNDQIIACKKAIVDYLMQHPVVEKDTMLVHFVSLGDYTLNLQILYYSLRTDASSYLTLQEELNLQILTICKSLGIEIAFPTQTVLMPTHH